LIPKKKLLHYKFLNEPWNKVVPRNVVDSQRILSATFQGLKSSDREKREGEACLGRPGRSGGVGKAGKDLEHHFVIAGRLGIDSVGRIKNWSKKNELSYSIKKKDKK
jgi:hypothetical protein